MLVAVLLAWTTLQFIDGTSAYPEASSVGLRRISTSIPDCSTSCVWDFIQDSFPQSICGNQRDLSCLCTKSGSKGFTLGEGILRCVVSNCVDTTLSQFQQVYAICDNIPGAISPTHSVITASMIRPSTIIFPTATSTAITTSASSSIATTTSSSFISTTTTTSSTISTSTSTSTASKSGSASAATTSSTPPPLSRTNSPVLTRAQIIGMSTGLGIATFIAMALLIYICYFRKRQNRDSSIYWGTNQPLMFSGEFSDGGNPRIIPIQSNPYIPAKAQSILGQNYPIWSPTASTREDYSMGFARSPRYEQVITPTPTSAATYKTTSKLLPDKPSLQYAMTAAPPRPRRDGTEGILLTVPATNTERRSPSETKASPDSFNSGPILNRQPSDPFSKPSAGVRTMSIHDGRASTTNLPKLDIRSRKSVQPPAAAYNPADYAQFAETQMYSRSPGPNNFLPGTAMTTNGAMPAPSSRSERRILPKEDQAFDKNKPIPPSKRAPIPSTVTSFEIDDDNSMMGQTNYIPQGSYLQVAKNTATPNSRPEIVRKLPPLVSSTTNTPQFKTPLSQIRYPSVPSLLVSPIHNQKSTSPYEFSPITPQVRRKDPIRLPQWDHIDLESRVERTWSIPRRPVQYPVYNSSIQKSRNLTSIPSSPTKSDISRIFHRDYAELAADQGSNTKHSSSEFSIPIQFHPEQDILYPKPNTTTIPMTTTLIPRKSVSPPNNSSRGARLGTAIANGTPRARTQFSPSPFNSSSPRPLATIEMNNQQSISNARNLHLHPALRAGGKSQAPAWDQGYYTDDIRSRGYRDGSSAGIGIGSGNGNGNGNGNGYEGYQL